MPKRISKSKNVQIATQKQIVNVVVGKGKSKGKSSRVSKQMMAPPLNTGVEASGLFIRSNIPPAPKYESFTAGRATRQFTPTEMDPRIIRSFPEPRPSPPGQEPQAYDFGFEDGTPPAFNENMLKRLPVKLEEIPIPNQGLYTTPVRPSMDASGPMLGTSQFLMGDPIFRYMDNMMATPSVKSEDKYMPRNSPYEEAEFK